MAIKNDAPSFNNRGFFALNTYDYDVGHARDLRGNRAYSLNIGSLSIDPFGPRKIFNFLSGGSFAGVIPAAPADATYFSIGLVR